MAVYNCRVDFEDAAQITDGLWSNVWHVIADDDVSALDQASNIASLSALLIPNDCNIIGVYSHSPTVIGSGLKATLAIPGSRTTTGERLPAWNVCQMRLPVATIRPILKYLRMGLGEGDIVGQNLGDDAFDAAEAFGTAVSAIPGLCTINGLILSGGPPQVTRRVCMRQLGWQRRARPGFVRGWVPV